ncbi:histidine kinase-, DNA gyrase B-, and HSP90-like ATPase family protein [Mycobacterium xenopi 3993]|nr:histidine kinase-, DNA gyrase B-, and HSP90-like ATPase family protein [Mycobacterium xenopi 3993]
MLAERGETRQCENGTAVLQCGRWYRRLEIADDGIGFNTSEQPLGGDEMGGYGLLSMAERAELVGGQLHIRSRAGSGTTVTATIPLTTR